MTGYVTGAQEAREDFLKDGEFHFVFRYFQLIPSNTVQGLVARTPLFHIAWTAVSNIFVTKSVAWMT
jgi:hypothetical protein